MWIRCILVAPSNTTVRRSSPLPFASGCNKTHYFYYALLLLKHTLPSFFCTIFYYYHEWKKGVLRNFEVLITVDACTYNISQEECKYVLSFIAFDFQGAMIGPSLLILAPSGQYRCWSEQRRRTEITFPTPASLIWKSCELGSAKDISLTHSSTHAHVKPSCTINRVCPKGYNWVAQSSIIWRK